MKSVASATRHRKTPRLAIKSHRPSRARSPKIAGVKAARIPTSQRVEPGSCSTGHVTKGQPRPIPTDAKSERLSSGFETKQAAINEDKLRRKRMKRVLAPKKGGVN